MVIGGITVIWLVYKFIKEFPRMVGEGLEAGFRSKFPNDFLMNLSWVVAELNTKGYAQASIFGAGSDKPGIVMKNHETDVEVEVRLDAPLFTDKGYSIVVANRAKNTALVLPATQSEENKELLKSYMG